MGPIDVHERFNIQQTIPQCLNLGKVANKKSKVLSKKDDFIMGMRDLHILKILEPEIHANQILTTNDKLRHLINYCRPNRKSENLHNREDYIVGMHDQQYQ